VSQRLSLENGAGK